MNKNERNEVWFVVGSQLLYGPKVLETVAARGQEMASYINSNENIPCKFVYKGTIKSNEEVTAIVKEANYDDNCVGIVAWCHTFSPSKMWINGLNLLQKPYCHFATQYNLQIPNEEIDMDFMNLNQAAHGDREHGFIGARMRLHRKVIVGYWKEESVLKELAGWMRAAVGYKVSQNLSVVRFGDNMREVAVTEGDKVEAQKQFGYSVNGYGVGDLVAVIKKVKDSEIDALINQYKKDYKMKVGASKVDSLREAARIEAGMRNFLEKGGFKAFTTTFEDLHGLLQLPGLAVQRLMADGYGFGAEGDWKTAALVRAMKVMAVGLKGGTSFMEDYTYHLDPKGQKVLGAHMLEVCSSIADSKPSLEVHPLGIGGKADPVRVVFNVPSGSGLNASLIDMGNRFRLIVNTVKVVKPNAPLPKLPVARVVWVPMPNLKVGAAAWIYAGGAHHTSFSMAVTQEYLEDFAKMADIEYVLIDENTCLSRLQKELRFNEMYYAMAKGF